MPQKTRSAFWRVIAFAITGLIGALAHAATRIPIDDPNISYSPYNWYRSGPAYTQSANPGAYLKLGFSGSSISVGIDVSPFVTASITPAQYPVVRWSVDSGPATTIQLTPTTKALECATHLQGAQHTLLFQYVSGYVFLDFWTPINVVRVTGFSLDDGAHSLAPFGALATKPNRALFLGDSITNGDDDIATFAGGITNAVDTQDATQGYPSVVSSALNAEYGVVAYGGASWDGNAADGHTPGLMTFFANLDKQHPRSFEPAPDDLFINMGENAPPSAGDVEKLISELRSACGPKTHIFLLTPFSGRSREPLTLGFAGYHKLAARDTNVFRIDLGDEPYLTDRGPTMLSVDGQHPLVQLHAQLAAKIIAARAKLLSEFVPVPGS